MMRPNVEEAKRALEEKPLLATTVERIQILDAIKSDYKHLPQPMQFAKTVSVLLSRVSVPVEKHDLIVGRAVDRELTAQEEEQFHSFVWHRDNPYRHAVVGCGHCTFSWEFLVETGLPGMRDMALEQLKTQESEDKKIFLTGLVEFYDAMIAFLLRYAQAAEDQGLQETAQNLREAARGKPQSFGAALQLLWMVTFVNCTYISNNPTLTVGRLDQILYPLYKAGLENGTLTREKTEAYITDYYCKHNLNMGRGEHQVGDASNSTTFDRILNFDAPQYLLLAGSDEHGAPAANELTELFARCIEPSFKNPVVVVRYTEGMDRQAPELWQILCRKALQSASLMFYNDRNVLSTLERLGVPPEDARKYAHFGCNWCSPCDDSAWMSAWPDSRHYPDVFQSEEERKAEYHVYERTASSFAWPEDLMQILRQLAREDPAKVTMEDVYRLFFERMSGFMDRKLDRLSRELAIRRRKPSALLTFADAFLEGSLRRAECFSAGAKYHFQMQSFLALGTVADCFIAVDQLVMIRKKLTLAQLLEAVEANFQGYPEILALCRGADKYGMDTELSNYHVRRLSHTAGDLVVEKSRPYLEREGLLLIPNIQSDTWHLKLGQQFGATPDGRLANTVFSQNSQPSPGACVNGLTAMFNSMLNLPTDGAASGALNLDVDPKQFRTEEGEKLFAALLATYFNRGGLHAQVSCADVKDLLDAQLNPHLHRDLRVRITGYSGVFTDICKRLQDDIIQRFS